MDGEFLRASGGSLPPPQRTQMRTHTAFGGMRVSETVVQMDDRRGHGCAAENDEATHKASW